MNNNDYQYTIKYIMIKRLTKNTTILANCIHSDCIVLSIKQAATDKNTKTQPYPDKSTHLVGRKGSQGSVLVFLD